MTTNRQTRLRGVVSWTVPATILRSWFLVPVFALTGCVGDDSGWHRLQTMVYGKPEAPPTDTFILRPDGLTQEKQPAVLSEVVSAELAAAREHFRKEEYDKAEALFRRVADNDRNPPTAVQEAMYYRGECMRLKGDYPTAADVYSGLLNKFPNCQYREQSVQHMFTIARYWLQDTYAEMLEEQERRQGKRWMVTPRFLSFEKSKPLLDREGRAIEKLEQVRLHDINGPLADQALFLCGVVQMYRENYREADHYFSQIVLRHPESKLAEQSLEMGIKCKHLSTGGSDYDGRKTAEARKLVQTAMRSYPNLARDPKKRQFLQSQLDGIDLQQAEKDFKIAEFYRRTGHPASAYFYYELVRRRYPQTVYAQQASERWNELRAQLEQERGGALTLNPQGIGTTNIRPTGATKQTNGAPATPPSPPPSTLPTPTPLPLNPALLPTPTSGKP